MSKLIKKKEWENKVQDSKWKNPVQTYGDLTCINGHKLSGDNVICGNCGKGHLYWVDPKEGYVICKGCNDVHKLRPIVCSLCGAKSRSKVKLPE